MSVVLEEVMVKLVPGTWAVTRRSPERRRRLRGQEDARGGRDGRVGHDGRTSDQGG